MKIEQLYTGCLSEAAYYIESEGEVAIIDPLRETQPYIDLAEKNKAKIKYVLETHFHADFVSGHVDLARESGAIIVYGPTAKTKYDVHVAEDGEILKVGKLKIKVLHTPGHTPESSTYLLYDETGKEYAIFSGDTVFIGDVGRPDLAISSEYTQEDLAGMLYDSIWKQIMPLPDHVLVYPAHGAGSLCGKNMSSETVSTLGEQRKTNYALQEMSREEFIAKVTDGIPAAPQYFAKNAALNQSGYEQIEEVIHHGNVGLGVDDFAKMVNDGVMVLDTRPAAEFSAQHIPGSVNISLDGSFAVWVGTLIVDLFAPLILVTQTGREEETVLRLARVGYDNTKGFLNNGIDAWKAAGKTIASIENISPTQFAEKVKAGVVVTDVRNPGEYETCHVENAMNKPLNNIRTWMLDLDLDQEITLHCKSGYRSMIAASILKSQGANNVVNVTGGMDEIKKTGLPLVLPEPV